MNVRVRLFAVARQLAGQDSVDAGTARRERRVGQLRRRLAAEVPDWRPSCRTCCLPWARNTPTTTT